MVEQIGNPTGMSPEQITEAAKAGKLDRYLGAEAVKPARPTDGKSPEEIAKEFEAGQLDQYLAEPVRRRS